MAYMKPGQPWLYDETTGDIVGVKDADGGDSFFVLTTRNPDGSTSLVGPGGVEIKTNGFDLAFKDMSISVPNATATVASTVTVAVDRYGVMSDLVNGEFTIPSWATGMEMVINVDWSDPAVGTSTVRYIGVELEVSAGNWFAFGIPGHVVQNIVGWETHQFIAIGAFESVVSNTGKAVRVKLYQASGGTLNNVHLHVGVRFWR